MEIRVLICIPLTCMQNRENRDWSLVLISFPFDSLIKPEPNLHKTIKQEQFPTYLFVPLQPPINLWAKQVLSEDLKVRMGY